MLIYNFVCPAKYRRVVFLDDVDEGIKNICLK
ncbi:MAG: IS200/IS605 family transposase, partial [Akkermansia sp.]